MKKNYTAHIAAGVLGFILLGGYVYLDKKYALYEAQQAAFNEPSAEPKEEIGQWNIRESKSPIDDRVTTIASVRSVYYAPSRLGQTVMERPTALTVLCSNHALDVYVVYSSAFFSDLGRGKQQVTFRLGDEPAFSREVTISTSNDALFVAQKDMIDVLRGLYGQKELLVAASDYSGVQLITRFPVGYAENALKPVLAACDVDLTRSQKGVVTEHEGVVANEPSKVEMGGWVMTESKSPIDDAVSVSVVLHSSYVDNFGSTVPVVLGIRCSDGDLQSYVNFQGAFFSEFSGKPQLTFRIGAEPAFSKNARVSTSNSALFIVGADFDVLIKALTGQEKLTVAAADARGRQLITIFDVKHVDNALKPVLEACKATAEEK